MAESSRKEVLPASVRAAALRRKMLRSRVTGDSTSKTPAPLNKQDSSSRPRSSTLPKSVTSKDQPSREEADQSRPVPAVASLNPPTISRTAPVNSTRPSCSPPEFMEEMGRLNGRESSFVRPPRPMPSKTTQPAPSGLKTKQQGSIRSAGSTSSTPRKATSTTPLQQLQRLDDTPITTRTTVSRSLESKSRDVSTTREDSPRLSMGQTKENRPTSRALNDILRQQHVQQVKRTDETVGTPLQRGLGNLVSSLPAITKDADNDDDDSVTASSDDESTAHDMEAPLAMGEREVLDATCLLNGSLVTIRACGSSPTVSVACVGGPQQELDISPLATTAMAGLGRAEQVFRVVKLFAAPGNAHESTGKNADVVRYGDTIALCSPCAQTRNLGVCKKAKQDESDGIHNVGFFRDSMGQAEQWTVLWGDTSTSNKRAVVVGSRALSRRHRNPTNLHPTAAVCSVDVILLRNNSTGGLLSFQQQDDELTVVTHSYNSSSTMNGSTLHTSLLDRLKRHSRIIPRPSETFQLEHASVPPCPQWVTSTSDGRFYLNGSYLLHPQRNESNPFIHESLFGSSQSKASFFEEMSLEATETHALSVQPQERLLLDEVIGSLMRLEGRHVKSRIHGSNDCRTVSSMDEVEFWLCDQELAVDTSLRNLVERILPLSTYYARVEAHVSGHLPGYDYGTAMQALCEGLDALLQDYLGFVSRMEQSYRRSSLSQQPSTFTMNKLYVDVQPSLETMSILYHVIVATRGLKGGALLNVLRDLMRKRYAGDEKGRHVLGFLLERASVPYMNMLTAWLETGVLQDPFGEFMVTRKNNGYDSRKRNILWVDYDGDDWDNLYQIREEHVLDEILSLPLTKQKILETGKFWNAVWYSRRTNRSSEEEDDDALVLEASLSSLSGNDQESISVLQYSMDLVSISSHIDRMYQSASRDLLQLILRDFSLTETLRTCKRFFLLDQGDFFVHFLDSAEGELLKEMEHVSRGRIQNWLSMSVQLTERHGEDAPSKTLMPGMHISLKKPLSGYPLTSKSLLCSFASDSLEEHLDALHAESGGIARHEPKTPSRHAYGSANKGLTGIEAFMLDFPSVPFPTSLVISKHALGSYQLLFRHLFFAKHVERRLVGVWLDHQMMKELQLLRKSLGPTYCLRQRMLHFMQNLIYYMMFEVIEPNWLEMEAAVNGRGKNGGDTGETEAQQTVDDVRRVHGEFLRRTLEECLLTNRDLIRTLTNLMKTCLLFSDQLKLFMKKTKISDENHDLATEKRRALRRNLNYHDQSITKRKRKSLRKLMVTEREERRNRIRMYTARVERELSNGSYMKMISRFEEVFNENLGEFMSELQSDKDGRYHIHRTNLCIRLDYNGYVSQSMGLN